MDYRVEVYKDLSGFTIGLEILRTAQWRLHSWNYLPIRSGGGPFGDLSVPLMITAVFYREFNGQ